MLLDRTQTFRLTLVLFLFSSMLALPVLGQQSGSISGTVTTASGEALPGVTIEASGDVLPRSRTAVTNSVGDYNFLLLPAGNYELTFRLEGMADTKRSVRLLLQQNVDVDVTLAADEIEETIEVIGEAPAIDTASSELKASISNEAIMALPVGQQYRDLIKLIPGVQYTEDNVRGPSAGGSGQDNVYLFDGVNVGLPLFGVLSAEPASHDIDQIAIVKGGADATQYNRSGGFTIDSVSKSGTNQFRGLVSFQVENDGMTSDRDVESDAEFDQDRDWSVVSLGGPLARDNAYFYASYFRPTLALDNRANLYGEVPDFDSTRDEFFGKITLTPADALLFNVSYRDSDREVRGSSVGGEASAGSTSLGSDATLGIAIAEGSWVVSPAGFLSFKYTDFENETSSRPDNLFGFDIADNGSVQLDVNNLDQQGLFLVPQPVDGEDAFNAFIAPLIDRYGFLENGLRTGGGEVGGANTINDADYFRESFEIGYDHVLGAEVSHQLHFGYQWARDEEDLSRESNGWGLISVRGGRSLASNGEPIFYETRFQQQSLLSAGGVAVPAINSQFEQTNIELNDRIQTGNWTFNVGVLLSNDELFGEGLRENPNNVSGFELAVGNRYKMYEVDFEDMIQPRLGAVWAFNGRDTVYANYARYHPAASSLPRAASWARNLRREIRGFFDADGNLIEVEPVVSSSGKFFQEGIDPRKIDEYLIGYSQQINPRLTGKAHFRYRKGSDFWEDTNNNARSRFRPPAGIPTEDYIPNLGDFRAEVGGSSYVIAELDGAFTKYYEVNLEADYRGRKSFLRGSYVWSHYYGNFDQDNTTTGNDAAIFVGSSFLADGAGRQLWDNRYGNLRGDRRHQFKAFGSYNFDWNASAGFYAIYQSGQPWEAWDVEVYRDLTGSTSDTSRFAEPAGSRTTDDHYQLDLNYTHNFPIGRYNVQLRGDVFNVFDNQTGYNIQNQVNSAGFGVPRTYFNPRRLQVAVRFEF